MRRDTPTVAGALLLAVALLIVLPVLFDAIGWAVGTVAVALIVFCVARRLFGVENVDSRRRRDAMRARRRARIDARRAGRGY